MKKIIMGFLVFICLINVNAKDYEILDIIPIDTKGNVSTKNFFYNGISYNNDETGALVEIDNVKNLDNEKRFLSISIGFYNDKKENIGIYNYCSEKDDEATLNMNEEMPLSIDINNGFLYKKNKVSDVKYIAVMSDNPNCNSGFNYNFVGRKAGYFDFKDNESYDYGYVKYYLYVFILIICILLIKFIFDELINKNNRLTNMILGIAGKKPRTDQEIKKEYFKRREKENLKNKKPQKKKNVKDISQEEGNTDLHKFYK